MLIQGKVLFALALVQAAPDWPIGSQACVDLAAQDRVNRVTVTEAMTRAFGKSAYVYVCTANYRCDSVGAAPVGGELAVRWDAPDKLVVYSDSLKKWPGIRLYEGAQKPKVEIRPIRMIGPGAAGLAHYVSAECRAVPPIVTATPH